MVVFGAEFCHETGFKTRVVFTGVTAVVFFVDDDCTEIVEWSEDGTTSTERDFGFAFF